METLQIIGYTFTYNMYKYIEIVKYSFIIYYIHNIFIVGIKVYNVYAQFNIFVIFFCVHFFFSMICTICIVSII